MPTGQEACPTRTIGTCRIGDVTGTIVDIGIRSTRFRTLNPTVVSIENFCERDKYHGLHVIGARYETDGAAMRGVLVAIRAVLAVVDSLSAYGAGIAVPSQTVYMTKDK